MRIPSEAELIVISSYLVKMQEADSPLDKLENLLAVISAIFNAVSNYYIFIESHRVFIQ